MKKLILPVFLAFCLCCAAPMFGAPDAAPAADAAAETAAVSSEDAAAATAATESQNVSAQTQAVVPATAAPRLAEAETPVLGSNVPGVSIVRVFGATGLVLCLIVGVYFGLRKIAPEYFPKAAAGGEKNLKIVESVGMGDRRSIVLVEVGGKRFLVGSTPQQINMLTTLPEQDSLVDEDSNTNSVLSKEDRKPAFRNLFDLGKKRPRNSGELPDNVRQKMRQLREALNNR